jgi:hypothetical protein
MKNEHEFNAYLKKEFKKHSEFKAIKISDRFKIGLPDWLLFHRGKAAVLECKWAKTCAKGNILGHTLSKPQVTSLKGFSAVSVPAMVLVGIEDERSMVLGCYSFFSETGNLCGAVVQDRFQKFAMTQVHELLWHLFNVSP